MTAFGRLGEWFASPSCGLEPDLIATAKGLTSGYLPLGAVLATREVGETLRTSESGFMHGYTYCGHPVACAVALQNLEIIEREELRANAIRVGAYLLDGLASLLELPVVGDVRGAGLLASVELVADKASRTPIQVRRQEIADRVRDEERSSSRTRSAISCFGPDRGADSLVGDELDRCEQAGAADVADDGQIEQAPRPSSSPPTRIASSPSYSRSMISRF